MGSRLLLRLEELILGELLVVVEQGELKLVRGGKYCSEDCKLLSRVHLQQL